MSSFNNRLNSKQKKQRYVKLDENGIADVRNAGEKPLFDDKAQWVLVPKEVFDRQPDLPRKRYILRRFMAPSPLSGNIVPCRELEGEVWCWEDPQRGFIFANSETPPEGMQVIDGGVGP